jgi:hypothetical protein
MNFKSIKNTLTLTAGRTGLVLKKYSPEILMGVGIVGIVTSTVLACKATLKAEDVIEDAEEKIRKIHQAREMAGTYVEGDGENSGLVQYSEEDYKKDMTTVYIQTGWGFTKLYGPAVTLGLLSIACMLGAHGIMRKRNLALVAAYKAIEQSFSDYRKRVKDELGDEADRHFKYGTEYVENEITDENGNVVSSEPVVVIDPNGISEYARIFDKENTNWQNTADYNMAFLKCQQSYANDLLQSRGHVFLNEIYDLLGLQRSRAGAVVGWVKDHGDNYIDFGMFDLTASGYRNDMTNDTIAEERRDFVNGCNKAILLDFNVDGIIYNMI